MGEGGKGQLDPPGVRQAAITGYQGLELFANQADQGPAVIQAEAPALALQGVDPRVVVADVLPGPGQVIPDQEVGEKLVVDVEVRLVVATEPVGQVDELPQAGEAIDEMGLVGLVAGEDQLPAPGQVQGQPRTGEGGQQGVMDALAGGQPSLDLPRVILDLFQQHRGEIDHGAGQGLGLQVRGHVRIVLEGMEIDPGQVVLATVRPPVVRLVHVPAQHHRQTRRVQGRGQGGISGHSWAPDGASRG